MERLREPRLLKSFMSFESVNIFNNNAFLTLNLSNATLIFQLGFEAIIV